MQNKAVILLASLLVAACVDLEVPYSPEVLNRLTVTLVYPEGVPVQAGAEVDIESISGGVSYSLTTDAEGRTGTILPDGIYRVSVSDTDGAGYFSGNRDRVVVSGADVNVSLPLDYVKAMPLVIKEIYCGGCPKTPAEGTYQSDQYVIIHNNSNEVQYLDSLCLGTVAPYNSNANNAWKDKDGNLPDFLPINEAVLMVPGDGTKFPLQPGGDAVIALRGAIDHSAQYPLSVNLNKPDYFVCYNITFFPNEMYHPAPGDQIREDHYLEVVIKTGQANAYTMSNNSPAFVIWKAKGIDIHDYVQQDGAVRATPGGSIYVTIVPFDWVLDGVEVFNGSSSENYKRLPALLDAGYVTLRETYKGRSLMRKVNEKASAQNGYEVLMDWNNSSKDLYERDTQSLHE